MTTIKPCCGNYEQCIEPCTPRGQWMATEALLNKKDIQFYFDGIPETKHISPPKREWVGLTDEEVEILIKTAWNEEQAFAGFVRSIEAKLKEKNGG
jgi:hypothetical protein